MAKNVEDRYQSAFGLKWDLEKCLELAKNQVISKNLVSTRLELAKNQVFFKKLGFYKL